MRTLRKVVRKGRTLDLTWRYLFNLAPTVSYSLNHNILAGEAARVVSNLNRDGVAVTSTASLLGSEDIYSTLDSKVHERRLAIASELETAQVEAESSASVGKKTFIFEYLGRNPVFDPDSAYARFALHPSVLGIANAYLGMRSRLRYYNVWHTFPTSTDARESQLWHRDREDFLIVKVFLYLSDVDQGAGPFTYARGSHPKGKFRTEAAYSLEGNVKRSTDAQLAEVIPPEYWFHGVGPKGTIIFADTRGYHRGGLARERARVMYTAMFTSRASQSQDFMVTGPRFTLPLDREQAFAVGGRK